MGNVQAPDKIRQLTEVEAARVSGNTVTAGNRTYLMSDNVLVYEYRGGDYYLSSLDRVKDGGYELSAWYDRSEKDGGRFRVIVAKQAAIWLLAEKYCPGDSPEHRQEAIRREAGGLCLVSLSIEHMTGKQAIELVQEDRRQADLPL